MPVQIDVPEFSDPNAAGIEARTQFLHDVGLFLFMWADLELGIELAIGRLAGMTDLNTSIVVGTLGHGAKMQILSGLLHEAGAQDTMALVRVAVEHAERNTLMHSITGSGEDFATFAFFRRDLRKGHYRVRSLEYSADEFRAHVSTFRDLGYAALVALKIDDELVSQFGRAARVLPPS